MSAFVVGHDHIDALMTYALDKKVSYWLEESRERVEINNRNVEEIGRILIDENERSVNHRYPDSRGDLPGTIGEDSSSYRYRRWSSPLTAVSILKACSCFDYQSCETGADYYKSLAYTIVDAIRSTAIRNVPGFNDAPGWEFRRASDARRAA